MAALTLLIVTLTCRTSIGARTDRLRASSEPVGPVDGLPSGSYWVDAETRKLARTELAQCVDPDVEPLLSGDTKWLPPLQVAAENHSGPGHAGTAWKPLEGFVEPHLGEGWGNWFSDNVVPWHRGAVTNSDVDKNVPLDMDYPIARCYQFNYSSSGPDPYGCRPFKKSFSRLQQLRQCIGGKLAQSRRWLMYREVGKIIIKLRRSRLDWDASLLEAIDPKLYDGLEHEELVLLDEIKANMSEDWEKWTVFDVNHRADEMVKYVAFKDWATLKNEGLIHLVQRKIRDTITRVALEEDIITEIRRDCFQVDVDSYGALPSETKTLRRAMPCVPLMWDSIEVGGVPHKPVSEGVTMWDEKYRYPPKVKLDLPNTPPVCGRIALALMKRPLIYAPKGYNPTDCVVGQVKWKSCMSLTHFNCICFEKCWVAALKRACQLAEGCCPDYEAMRGYDKLIR